MEPYENEQGFGNLTVSFGNVNDSGYQNGSDGLGDVEGSDLNKHTTVFIIYRIIVPIICGCGILGIILTGKFINILKFFLLNLCKNVYTIQSLPSATVVAER